MKSAIGRLLAVSLLAIVAPHLGAFADWLHAQVSVQSDYVFVGQPFTVRIRVLGTVTPDRPDTSVVKDFAVEYNRNEWNPSRGDTVFIYRFRAERAGVLHIPPIPVSGGGTSTKTPRVTVRARPIEETEATLTVEFSTADCYVGQRVVGYLDLRFRGEGRGYRFEAPFLHDERFIAVLPTRGLVSHPPDGYTRVQVNQMPALAQVTKEGSGDSASNTVRVPVILIPQETGTIELAEAGVLTRIQRAKRRQPEELYVNASSESLVVRTVPEANQPPNFSGLVGRYKLQASADAEAVQVGDPIALTLTLTGEPYLLDVEVPDLLAAADLEDEFQVSAGALPSTSRGNAMDFHYTLRPVAVAVREIPRIAFNYFDPDTGRYVSAHTNSVPLRVSDNRVLTADDAEGAAGAPGPRSAVPEDSLAGIAHNFDGPEALTAQSLGLAALFASPFRTGAIAIPPIAFLVLLLSGYVERWRKTVAERTLTPWEEFERSEHHDVPALRRYVEGVGGKLSLASPETLETLRLVLDAEDARKFGGAGPRDLPDVRALARRIHEELDR